LRRVESMAAFNSSLLEGVLVSLMQARVLDSKSVMKWLLREVGDSLVARIIPNWYKFAIVAVREELLLSTSDATAGGIMVIEDGSSPWEDELVITLTTRVAQLLTYTVQRVCGLLVATMLDEKKLKPVHVDLIEGTKRLVFRSKALFIATLTRPSGIRKPMLASEAEDVISKSEMSGASLAAICSADHSRAGAVLLKQSLEKLTQ